MTIDDVIAKSNLPLADSGTLRRIADALETLCMLLDPPARPEKAADDDAQ